MSDMDGIGDIRSPRPAGDAEATPAGRTARRFGLPPALRAAFVIARRDYVASVWSRTFLLFLVGPILPLLAAALFGGVGASMDRAASRARVAVIAAPADAQALAAARQALAARMGEDALPELVTIAPAGNAAAQAGMLLRDDGQRIFAVLAGGIERPVLTGPAESLRTLRDELALLIDRARADRALAGAGAAPPPEAMIGERVVGTAAGNDASARMLTARLAQLLLMMLTMILTGMLLSNLIEEKSNKVIEVLAAAVPVDAIFLGKLIAMLAMSLTGIAIWGTVAGTAAALLVPALAALPAPAVGWPLFAVLGTTYFCAIYLLLGAVFLGLGAQASSVREVQTLSMPVTMAQLGVVGFASAALADLDGPMGISAALFPWSSPFAMLARAAERPALWPHLAAIGWQVLWIAVIVKLSARMFRRSVLKSGGPRGLFRRRAREG